MLVDRKPFIYLWRPMYRMLCLIRGFFTAETRADAMRVNTELQACRGDIAILAQSVVILKGQTDVLRGQIEEIRERVNAGISETQHLSVKQIDEISRIFAAMQSAESDVRKQWSAIERLLMCVLAEPASYPAGNLDTRQGTPGETSAEVQ